MKIVKAHKRYFYLDWVRIIATAGVFILHVAHIFDDVPFQIQNKNTSMFFLIVVVNLNFWIMPLFFLVAGASSYISLKKRNNIKYIKERIIRLIIPFCTGLLLLSLPQDYVEALNYNKFSGSFIDFIPFHFNNIIDLIRTSNILFSTALFAEFSHHVWFLAFLFIYSIFLLPLFRLLQDKFKDILELLTSKLNSPTSLYLPLIPLFTILATLKPLDPTYSGWPDFIYWGSFFIIGFVLFSNQKAINILGRNWYMFLAIGIISFMLILFYLTMFGTALYNKPDYSFTSIVGHFLWVLTSYSWVMFLIGLGHRFLNFKNNKLLRVTSVSMAFYLIHLPIILIVAYFVVQFNFNLYLKFIVIFIVSFFISILLIEGVIKRLKVLSLIFGLKR